jgi:predicted homoserine dehydrogenase-like protein
LVVRKVYIMGLRGKLEELEREGTPIRVGLVGAGQMGQGFIAQVGRIPGIEVVAAADLDLKRVTEAFKSLGQEPAEDADGSPGRPKVTDDAVGLSRSESVDVVVEATGIPEIGARVAFEAINSNKHTVMLNAEADVTVGPILGRMAQSAGVVYTGTAGDEPGAIMGLYDFARSLGFEVVVAGKGKNNPLELSATPETVAEEAASKDMNPKMLASFVDGTKTMVEMAAVANATGMSPDKPGMHGPEETDPQRLGDVFSLKEEGGILSDYDTVDYVKGVAPGVFVVVRTEEGPVRETMEYLGQGAGPNHVLYRPYHLTSLETPMSVARAAIYGESTIVSKWLPTAEVVAVAKRDLEAGEKLGGIGSADYYGCVYGVTEARKMLPLGLAEGANVKHRVERGSVILREDVDQAQASFIVSLRRLQEAALPDETA